MNLCVIPARGGSKRIPGKNTRDFFGIPIIGYSIVAAKNSRLFDKIIVSTDDEKVAQIAIKMGAEVPFFRPPRLSSDNSATAPVIRHAVKFMCLNGMRVINACCIYPAAPFVDPSDLIASFDLLQLNKSVDYCFPVAEFPAPVQRSLVVNENGVLKPRSLSHMRKRSQKFSPSLYDAGQFYWGRTEAWTANSEIYRSALGYRIPSWRAIDINTEEDWLHAEITFRGMSTFNQKF